MGDAEIDGIVRRGAGVRRTLTRLTLVSLAGLVLLAAPLWAPVLEKWYEWYDSVTADD